MAKINIDPEILKAASKVASKRPKTVIDHIIKHGFITTEELESLYGYTHPPRAARDVRENGIPLETFKVKSSDGRNIAAYRFGDPQQIVGGKLGGRKVFPKQLKGELIDKHGSKCHLCCTSYEEKYLQIDHRIPYEVGGDFENTSNDRFMLVCAACNRKKSWECEGCTNWQEVKKLDLCQTCYWASPENYNHTKLKKEIRLEAVFTESEVDVVESYLKSTGETIESLRLKFVDFIKKTTNPG